MSGLLLYDLGEPTWDLAYSNGARYADYINGGLRLLQAESQGSESVVILEQNNPFSYALLRKPGRAASPSWPLGTVSRGGTNRPSSGFLAARPGHGPKTQPHGTPPV